MLDSDFRFEPFPRRYKYRMTADYSIVLVDCAPECPPHIGQYLGLIGVFGRPHEHVLTLRKGYACDGPSGPTVDTASTMRGAFLHDGLYQLMREGVIPASYRRAADAVLASTMVEDGEAIIGPAPSSTRHRPRLLRVFARLRYHVVPAWRMLRLVWLNARAGTWYWGVRLFAARAARAL